MQGRFDCRLQPSRRLRAALLLLAGLSVLALSQTSLRGLWLALALLAVIGIFAHAWWRTKMPNCRLRFGYRPVTCALLVDEAEITLDGLSVSVYPWLIVLRFAPLAGQAGLFQDLPRPLVLLPDSLLEADADDWRRLLVWAHQCQRGESTANAA